MRRNNYILYTCVLLDASHVTHGRRHYHQKTDIDSVTIPGQWDSIINFLCVVKSIFPCWHLLCRFKWRIPFSYKIQGEDSVKTEWMDMDSGVYQRILSRNLNKLITQLLSVLESVAHVRVWTYIPNA